MLAICLLALLVDRVLHRQRILADAAIDQYPSRPFRRSELDRQLSQRRRKLLRAIQLTELQSLRRREPLPDDLLLTILRLEPENLPLLCRSVAATGGREREQAEPRDDVPHIRV